jgi:hypothetical protein
MPFFIPHILSVQPDEGSHPIGTVAKETKTVNKPFSLTLFGFGGLND